MEPRVLQKRVFMRGRPGGDAPKDRHAYIPQGPGTETTEERKLYLDRFPSQAESDDQGKEHVLQKRVFMRGRPGGDAPKDRHAYVPEKQRFESAQERRMHEAPASQEDDSENVHASALKKLLIVRDRVRAIHEKLDSVIDRYQRNGESREKLMRGEDDLQLRKWEKILKGFVTD